MSMTINRRFGIMFTVVNGNTYFSDWLKSELEKRAWSQAELARRAGLNRATINSLLSGRNHPRAETCLAIARGLDIPPETALKAADLLPETELPDFDKDPTLQELFDIVKRLPKDERQQILEYTLWRYQQTNKED